MTKTEAWKHIVECMGDSKPDIRGEPYWIVFGKFCKNICRSISALYNAGQIDWHTADEMSKEVCIDGFQSGRPRWEYSKRGLSSRVEFCQTQYFKGE